jgi:hypothetical protein
MKKELRTARELEQMIIERMPDPVTHLEVRSDRAHGWAPFVLSSSPNEAAENQRRAEQIAAELRQTYDLKS